jgi:molybdate transport system substrate-binding protein
MKRILSFAVVLCLCGCVGRQVRHDPDADLRVYGTHRISEPLQQIADAFAAESGLKVSARLGCARPKIIPTMKKNRDGDVFVTGSAEELELIKEAGLAESDELVASNPFVLVIGKNNPLSIERVEDLKKPGVKLILPKAGRGCASRLTNRIIENYDLVEQAGSAKRLNLKCQTTSGMEMVAAGEADATFMWRIVAVKVDGVELVPIEREKGAPCDCFAVLLKDAANKANAENFVQFLKSDRAQEIFRKHGLLDRNGRAAQ